MDTKKKEMSLKNKLISLFLSPEVAILIPLIVICIITGVKNPKFFNSKNLLIIIRFTAFIGSLTIGEAFALMCGEIDLSVGTCSALTATIFGVALGWLNLSFPVAVLLALGTGLLVGAVNAFFTLKFKMSSWIVTMSMQYICSGFAIVILKGDVVSGLGDTVKFLSKSKPLGLSYMFFVYLAIVLITEVLIRFTPVGRKVQSVGLSVPAASIAGINVKKVKTCCFMFSGFMAGVCGILQCISNQAQRADIGQGNDFPAIICCVIGGVSNMGGKGTMLGAFIGVLMYQTLKNCLQTLKFSANSQLVMTGLILIMAVCFDVLKTKFNQRARVMK